ncbi:endonuclease/exonuclease/phosphatase family protein [Candidatus Protochlamydia phocaeensis]|uniref:endonuclease/exonuclease/phosphatase family protein n=1 Tax=Candidatus Protochlamydia phocaeensis TaxID=1414722 RepID=UPI0008398165|nr:endonuclease/exonuclease/phosphatase family protein [Candidatus Protochlamydia phocaeensis]
MGISVGTFNILDPNFAVSHNQAEGLSAPGKSNWGSRKEGIVRLIQSSHLDVICLQEISARSLNDMKAAIEAQGYEIVHVPHSGRIDGLAILYKKGKLEPKDFRVLSKHGLESCYVDLKDQTTGKMIRVANCHLLGGPKSNQGTEQIEALVKEVDKEANHPIDARIIVGDFNADEKQLNQTNSKFQALKQANYAFDGNLSPTEPGKNRHIDWIWVRSSAQLASLAVPHPSVPVSDHQLLATQLNFQATVLSNNPLPSTLSQVISAPFQHTQPNRSFRAKMMSHFSVTGWDAGSKKSFAEKLDGILTQCANANPFLPTIRQKFAEYVDTLLMTASERQMLREDLERAIQAAQEMATRERVRARAMSALQTGSVSIPASGIGSLSQEDNRTPAPLASRPSNPSTAPVTLFQHVKAFFRGIASFFSRLFGFR